MNPLRPARWVLLAAALLTAAAAAWRISAIVRSHGSRAVGDGRDPATYGFDLSGLPGPRAALAATGLPRDGLRALDFPAAYPASEFPPGRRGPHGKLLVGDDRVAGLELHGETRAYPVRVLAWHEAVNDTLAGVPVLVTYSPLCDGVAVYDRRPAGAGGRALTFGVSGLLLNSNTLCYDRESESLWCQFTGRAVSGAAAARGERLARVPFLLLRWREWKALHPAAAAVAGERDFYERYVRDPYVNYFGTRMLRFPVQPTPPADGPAPMTPYLGIFGANGELRALLPAGGAPGEPAPLHAALRGGPGVEGRPTAAWGLWFAWQAFYTAVVDSPEVES